MNRDIKVKSNTQPKKLAGSIMHTIDSGATPVLLAIGAGATNTAIKACAVAVKVFGANERKLVVVPEFSTEIVKQKEMTVMRIRVEELV